MSGHISKLLKEQMEMVNLTINNIPLTVPKGTKIMQAAQEIGIDIPHLCYHEDQSIKAHCRLCSVEVTGRRRLLAACSTEVWEGMAVPPVLLSGHHRNITLWHREQSLQVTKEKPLRFSSGMIVFRASTVFSLPVKSCRRTMSPCSAVVSTRRARSSAETGCSQSWHPLPQIMVRYTLSYTC